MNYGYKIPFENKHVKKKSHIKYMKDIMWNI